jgi:3-mercaptopyruvate sulfurtransferase SseA
MFTVKLNPGMAAGTVGQHRRGRALVQLARRRERQPTRAASLLQRAGHSGLAVLAGGAGDWSAATGKPLEEGA